METDRCNDLSPTQKKCLRLFYDRKSTGDIAVLLGISKSTVESHFAQARRTVGVTRTIHAAEMLHAHEAGPSREPSTYPAPVPLAPSSEPSEQPGRLPWWRATLPLRLAGATGNELSILQRLGAVFIVSLGLAIGFGSIASGFHAISDIIRRLNSP